MTPPMYMRLKDLFMAEGLTAGLRSSGGNGATPGKIPISSSYSGLQAAPISPLTSAATGM